MYNPDSTNNSVVHQHAELLGELCLSVEREERRKLRLQTENPESSQSEERLNVANYFFYHRIVPLFKDRFILLTNTFKDSKELTEEMRIEILFSQIKGMILNAILDSPDTAVSAVDKKWLQENRTILLDSSHEKHKDILAQARKILISRTNPEQVAWRNFDPDAPLASDTRWKNLITGAHQDKEIRRRVAYYYLACIDPALSEADSQFMKANFIGKLADIRRGHNEGVRVKLPDDPSCPNGTIGRTAEMGQQHPKAQLPLNLSEQIMLSLKEHVARNLKVFFDSVQGIPFNEKLKFRDALLNLHMGNLFDIRSSKAEFSEELLNMRFRILEALGIEMIKEEASNKLNPMLKSSAFKEICESLVASMGFPFDTVSKMLDENNKHSYQKIRLMLLDPASYFIDIIKNQFLNALTLEERNALTTLEAEATESEPSLLEVYEARLREETEKVETVNTPENTRAENKGWIAEWMARNQKQDKPESIHAKIIRALVAENWGSPESIERDLQNERDDRLIRTYEQYLQRADHQRALKQMVQYLDMNCSTDEAFAASINSLEQDIQRARQRIQARPSRAENQSVLQVAIPDTPTVATATIERKIAQDQETKSELNCEMQRGVSRGPFYNFRFTRSLLEYAIRMGNSIALQSIISYVERASVTAARSVSENIRSRPLVLFDYDSTIVPTPDGTHRTEGHLSAPYQPQHAGTSASNNESDEPPPLEDEDSSYNLHPTRECFNNPVNANMQPLVQMPARTEAPAFQRQTIEYPEYLGLVPGSTRLSFNMFEVQPYHQLHLPSITTITPYNPDGGGQQFERVNHGVPLFSIAAELKNREAKHLPPGVVEQLAKYNIPIQSLLVLFGAQTNSWRNTRLLLRPHPWLHFDAPANGEYHRNSNIRVGLADIKGKFEELAQVDNVYTHLEHGQIVYSAQQMPIIGIENTDQSHAFYSLVIDPATRRAALTLHFLVNDDDHDNIQQMAPTVNSLEEYIKLQSELTNSSLSGDPLKALKALLEGGHPAPDASATNQPQLRRYSILEEHGQGVRLDRSVRQGELLRFNYGERYFCGPRNQRMEDVIQGPAGSHIEVLLPDVELYDDDEANRRDASQSFDGVGDLIARIAENRRGRNNNGPSPVVLRGITSERSNLAVGNRDNNAISMIQQAQSQTQVQTQAQIATQLQQQSHDDSSPFSSLSLRPQYWVPDELEQEECSSRVATAEENAAAPSVQESPPSQSTQSEAEIGLLIRRAMERIASRHDPRLRHISPRESNISNQERVRLQNLLCQPVQSAFTSLHHSISARQPSLNALAQNNVNQPTHAQNQSQVSNQGQQVQPPPSNSRNNRQSGPI